MELRIKTLHFAPSKELDALVLQQLDQLYQLFDKIDLCEIVLKRKLSNDDDDEAITKQCLIKVEADNVTFKASTDGSSFTEAVTKAFNAVHAEVEELKLQTG